MKKTAIFILAIFGLFLLASCSGAPQAQVVTTTLPVYDFTSQLCQGTDLTVTRLINEEVSCLHDYSLQTRQMRAIEGAELVVISGGGLEDFLGDVIAGKQLIDASASVELHCGHDHAHEGHSHENDPHIWLSPENAKTMVHTICHSLTDLYPEHGEIFHKNEEALLEKLDVLQAYGQAQLANLSCRELITFHDGFSYLADAFDLTILEAIEEESGSEASAAELKELIYLVRENRLPAIFTEKSGSVSAAGIISKETGASIYSLDMAMSGESYFDAMYHNIDTLKEALG